MLKFENIYPQIIRQIAEYCPEQTIKLTSLNKYKLNPSIILYYRKKYLEIGIKKRIENYISHDKILKRGNFKLERSKIYPNILIINCLNRDGERKIYRIRGTEKNKLMEFLMWKKYLLGKGIRYLR